MLHIEFTHSRCCILNHFANILWLIYPSTLDGDFSCFHLGAIINRTATKILVHIFWWNHAYTSGSSGISGSKGISFSRYRQSVFQSGCSSLNPSSSVWEFSCFTSSLTTLRHFHFRRSSGFTALSHYSFNLHFPGYIPFHVGIKHQVMDGGAWRSTVLGVANSRTWLSD